MDIKEDDRLLDDFFRESAQMEIADNGFSGQVSRRIRREYGHRRTAARIWTAVCAAIAVVLVFVCGRGIDIRSWAVSPVDVAAWAVSLADRLSVSGLQALPPLLAVAPLGVALLLSAAGMAALVRASSQAPDYPQTGRSAA